MRQLFSLADLKTKGPSPIQGGERPKWTGFLDEELIRASSPPLSFETASRAASLLSEASPRSLAVPRLRGPLQAAAGGAS